MRTDQEAAVGSIRQFTFTSGTCFSCRWGAPCSSSASFKSGGERTDLEAGCTRFVRSRTGRTTIAGVQLESRRPPLPVRPGAGLARVAASEEPWKDSSRTCATPSGCWPRTRASCSPAVATWAWASAPNTAISTPLDQVLLRLLPRQSRRGAGVARRYGSQPGRCLRRPGVLVPDVPRLRDKNEVFAGVIARFLGCRSSLE